MSSITHEQQQQNEHSSLNERVKGAFSLTEEDLAVNRAGQMTVHQQDSLRRKHTQAGNDLFSFLLIVAALAGCFITVIMSSGKPFIKDVSGVGFIVALFGGGGLFMFFKATSLESDIHNNRVMSIKGTVTRRAYRTKEREYWWVISGAKKFDVPRPIYDGFVDHKTYILYYTAISETLIAAEHFYVPPSPQ